MEESAHGYTWNVTVVTRPRADHQKRMARGSWEQKWWKKSPKVWRSKWPQEPDFAAKAAKSGWFADHIPIDDATYFLIAKSMRNPQWLQIVHVHISPAQIWLETWSKSNSCFFREVKWLQINHNFIRCCNMAYVFFDFILQLYFLCFISWLFHIDYWRVIFCQFSEYLSYASHFLFMLSFDT